MPKVSIVSEPIKSKRTFREKNVTSIVVSNLSNVATTFIFNGVVRKVLAVDVSGVPTMPFHVSDNGNHFDIELIFNQDNNDLILDYTVLVPKEEKC
ncbi:hypothetical protein FLCU109888_11520 [Flavobacterium cucumis]|uniref:Uncharacterized protein n=1 Tax=Flavobacterium cucumis TaxID=416016 RepID=A0A1M7ZVR5_9FLAO|nr:hypothetical protein [Flavobacterium cucumis]SHO72880.1 hypothetical protein SAMN05443547_1224 [Flavobacterium cucumis]